MLVPGGGGRWVSMNTTIKPFDDINVRKAVIAGMDRNALRLTRGGELIGDIATHFLPPGMAGFEEAGGMEGTGVDFISPDGKPQPEVSAKYFKEAGYASGKYEGTEEILMVGSNAGVAAKTAEVVKENLEKHGLQGPDAPRAAADDVHEATATRRRRRSRSARTSAGCKDFADGQTMLSPTFAGKNILEQGNSNWPRARRAGDQRGDRQGRAAARRRSVAAAWAAIDKMVVEQAPADPVDLGQDPADPVRQRQRRGLGVQRPVGPGLDVAQVSSASSHGRMIDGPAPRGHRRLTGA